MSDNKNNQGPSQNPLINLYAGGFLAISFIILQDLISTGATEKVFDPEDSRDGESQMGKHASASRDLDESLRGLGQALMVAGKATPPRDPAEGSFHHPSPGLEHKACRGRLGLWLRLHGMGIVSCPQTLHGLHVPSELLFDPLKKLSPVMTIAPNQREPGKATLQWLKQLLAESSRRSHQPPSL
jgi:hypothetical protein